MDKRSNMPPSAGSYILYNPAFSTFAGIADDNKTVVGYTTLDKAQVVRHRLYFPVQASLQYVLTQWELGSDNHIRTVLRNGQTKYMRFTGAETILNDSHAGYVWSYTSISANLWR